HTLTCNSSLPILSFFLIIPHPPISTLFPYTTLFRSQYFGTARHVERRITGRKGASPTLVVRGSVRVVAAGASRLGSFSAADLRQDRKSTRLNSSHSQISYAVFCLKKKKKQNTSYYSYYFINPFSFFPDYHYSFRPLLSLVFHFLPSLH